MSQKEKIVPITSVAADKGQSTKSNVIITENWKESNQRNIKNFEQGVLYTITMEELYDTAFPPKIPIVDGLFIMVPIFLLVLLKWENHFLWHS